MTSLFFRATRSSFFLIALAALATSGCSTTKPAGRVVSRDYFTAPVFEGDTLATFAERYQVQPNDVLALNRVRHRNGRVTNGQLKVPLHPSPREQRMAPGVQAAAQHAPPIVTQVAAQPAVITPQVATIQPRPASIEARSLAPLSVTSTRNASVTANGLDASRTAVPPAVTASRSPEPPAAELQWYDWFVPVTPPVASPSDTEQRFLWPVEGRVISSFGDSPNGGRNDGINIAVARGTPVRSADSGEVSYVGNELKGYGNLIIIRHDNGFITAYAHADGVHVKRGERVERGQVIATVGDTGNVSQPQLHFELRNGTQPVDPTPYLVASPKAPSTGSSKRLAEGAR